MLVGAVLTALGIHLLPLWLVPAVVLTPIAIAAAVLERARPERADCVPFDQPLAIDAAHFLLNANLGYALAAGAIEAVRPWVALDLWATSWPLPLQVGAGLFLGDSLAYWQHRLYHRVPFLWRFHALHHSGARLNLVRAGRFHFVDIGPAAFCAVLPMTVLGAPEAIVTWVLAASAVFSILQHANIRLRTPWWLDAVICTPAAHRHHHGSGAVESNQNFGTLVMLFDRLFGSYAQPDPAGPDSLGLDDDPVPRGFWPQLLSPFRPGGD